MKPCQPTPRTRGGGQEGRRTCPLQIEGSPAPVLAMIRFLNPGIHSDAMSRAGIRPCGRFDPGECPGINTLWQGADQRQPLAERKERLTVDALAPFAGDTATVHAALEVSGTSWILAVGDPADASKSGIHRLAPHDVSGLLAKLEQVRGRASASGGDARVMLVYEAGNERFWLARRLGGEDLDVLVCDPASIEVVRALRAWDGGDRDAMRRGGGVPVADGPRRSTWTKSGPALPKASRRPGSHAKWGSRAEPSARPRAGMESMARPL